MIKEFQRYQWTSFCNWVKSTSCQFSSMQLQAKSHFLKVDKLLLSPPKKNLALVPQKKLMPLQIATKINISNSFKERK